MKDILVIILICFVATFFHLAGMSTHSGFLMTVGSMMFILAGILIGKD